jgi:hypothetical protein
MALGANSSGRAGAARFYGLFWQGRTCGTTLLCFKLKPARRRLEAKNAHAKKINQRLHYAGLAVGCASWLLSGYTPAS